MVTDIESVLFDEMTSVNSQLISLASKVKLVDNRYFVNNSGMIDEFIENIHEFLKQVDIHRRKVSSEQLNSDNLFHIYQFLDLKNLVHCCQLVCKSWKQTLNRVNFTVKVDKSKTMIGQLVKSSLITNVTSLRMQHPTSDMFKSLSSCKKLQNLKTLDLNYSRLGKTAVKYLAKCQMPNLTELKLNNASNFTEIEAKELFHSSSLLSNIKKLEIQHEMSKEFIEILSNSKYLKNLSHLNLKSLKMETGNYGLDLCLKDKNDLERLEIRRFNLTNYPKLLTDGSFMNLTFLDIAHCSISNRELGDLLVSPNLPKLATLHASCSSTDNSIIELPTDIHTRSSLTDLNFSNIASFPSLANYCTNLLKLTIIIPSIEKKSSNALIDLISSPNLSNLKRLDISCWDEIFEILFTSPNFTKLEELHSYPTDFRNTEELLTTELILNCKTLINLRLFQWYGMRQVTSEEGEEAFFKNPTFSKLNFDYQEFN
ncbi:hypothetical protein NAEGRDRAFT_54100 [Naegleria gruberi]|uniref:F-box domain-containing protein n=1 Tax=Naegleria gruberi TaxID=5762 RepID=D2W242_NAEGR|nr:uncharacterized protein NAEGRDRAFT_54100 [Naegleria gruberi]EFC36918.1 hypothetical protein NAEGRDRAFT_54100 [Naegleria gruberi]|eukprot:XP_002669662.1 hypothetical protein NAEGRDRAFT_54100 [Naegleria gruberi strain NEG-M]